MIEVKNLKKSYASNLIFENVSFKVEKGEAVVIIGNSGTGKTTLLRCINRLTDADEGEVWINGKNILANDAKPDEIRKGMGMVYQNFNLFSHLNVLENVILAPTKIKGEPLDEAIANAERILDRVGLKGKMYHMPKDLSGGQKQRVGIARALAMNPEVILFDEPTSALDPTMVDEVENVINLLKNEGMTCIIVTHEMRFAKRIASKVIFLAEKGIYEMGSAKEIFEKPSKELTRKFLYRARMFSEEVEKNTIDIFSLASNLRAFAVNYGLSKQQNKAIQYLIEELLLPVLTSMQDENATAFIRMVCDEDGGDHQLMISFKNLAEDPLESEILDELNLMLIKGFTREISSSVNGEGYWEVKTLI